MNRGDHPRSLLIIHPGALGDVLLALPAMAILRNLNRSADIILLAGSEVGNLLLSCGVVDHVLTTESGDLASLMGGAEHLSIRQRALLQRCDRVIGWLKDCDGSVRSTLQQLGVRRITLESPTPQAGVHQSVRYWSILDEARQGSVSAVQLIVPETVRQAGVEALQALGIQDGQDVVLCHPGSGSVHKCVQPETMGVVLQAFRIKGVTPVIVGGPADDAAIERIRASPAEDVPVIQNQNLKTLAGVLVQARLLVGHDSGVTHLAAVLQIPTVAIFGPTDPLQWAPQGGHVSVVKGPSCFCSGWDQVRACEAKPCLAVKPDNIVLASLSLLRRYPTVTNS